MLYHLLDQAAVKAGEWLSILHFHAWRTGDQDLAFALDILIVVIESILGLPIYLG
jgi:hypothetical protein